MTDRGNAFDGPTQYALENFNEEYLRIVRASDSIPYRSMTCVQECGIAFTISFATLAVVTLVLTSVKCLFKRVQQNSAYSR